MVEILMPKLGLTMTTGTVVKWLKNEGDAVCEKEPVLEIETEKLSYIVESPAAGSLVKRLAAAGEKYPIASVLGYIGIPGEALPASEADRTTDAGQTRIQPEASRPERVFISPVARKLAASMGIDYKPISGTGPNGRIVKADILRFAENRASCTAENRFNAAEPPDIIPYTGMRRAIGENMLNAWSTIPMVTHHVSADVTALLDYRALLNDGVDRSERVSVNEILMKLTAVALIKMPVVNSSLTEAGIAVHRHVHLGMATALDNGLVVPVIRDANTKSLLEISREAKDLAARARSGQLKPDELRGATFTVSNLGGYGSVDYFTPIINPPQAAILGVGRAVDTAVPVDGEIKIRAMLGLSFSYDHRIIDGATAAVFMRTLMELLEKPARAVLEP